MGCRAKPARGGDIAGTFTLEQLETRRLLSAATWAQPHPPRRPFFGSLAQLTAAPARAGARKPGAPIKPGASPSWQGPIVINKGGVYSGQWQSLDPHIAAVTIATRDPVVIQNSSIQSMGDCIVAAADDVHLTVLQTHGVGLNPNVLGRAPGRFVSIQHFDSIDLENNTLEHTAGIYLGYNYGTGPIKVLRNSALDIDGRHSDGHGSFLAGPDDYDEVQFCQIAYVNSLPGIEIAWNQVINRPGESRVEDNISVYKSSGTPDLPILIHDNYIQGAYPADPATQDYSGGGIMLGDGAGCGYVQAFNNQVVSTTNYGIGIPSGHDESIYNNRVVSSGLLPDGTGIHAQNSGIYVWNEDKDPAFANDSAYNNVIGWMGWDDAGNWVRKDHWMPNATIATGNVALPGPITLQTEAAEYALWTAKLAAAGVVVG